MYCVLFIVVTIILVQCLFSEKRIEMLGFFFFFFFFLVAKPQKGQNNCSFLWIFSSHSQLAAQY